jgi:hypothetical protein
MSKVTKVINTAGRTVELLGWKILSDSRVVGPRGEVMDDLPTDVAYSNQAKHLADLGLVTIRGYTAETAPKKPVASEAPVIPDLPKADDLTELANIGASRVKKLDAKGIFTFQNIVDYGAEKLSDLLQIESAVAESIVNEAAGKLGVGSE